jgi:siroheme decarboxylase
VIDEQDKRIIRLIQEDLPLAARPFAVLAEKIGITEDEFIARVRALKERGVIRRFGASLFHQKAGFSANAMVAWCVPEGRIVEIGEMMAGFREITHCYQRRPMNDWKYNLYTMIHGNTREECGGIARRISQSTGMNDYVLLFSEKEFKKTSMQYF